MLEDGTDRLSRNVCKKFALLAVFTHHLDSSAKHLSEPPISPLSRLRSMTSLYLISDVQSNMVEGSIINITV
jgi:hypothetical protein